MESCDLKEGKLEQLDLNAPLISTRRLCGLAGYDNTPHRTREAVFPSPGKGCRSVPFLWEAAPGVPKAADRAHDACREAFELPRPPPGRWRPAGDDGSGGDSEPRRRGAPDDSGEDGDVDNGSGGGNFSDSADVASLSDSLSVACSLSRVNGVLDIVCVEEGGELGRVPSPGFMMQRFLPAAAALASSFTSGSPRKPPRRVPRPPRHHQYHPTKRMTIEAGLGIESARRSRTRSYSSSKACGIKIFFPWGFKQAFCGFKTSVQSRASLDRQNHGSSRPGAHDSDSRHSFRFEAVDADGSGGGGAGMVHRARTLDTPGWGLRFLDCRGCEGVAVAVAERGCEGGGGKCPGKAAWRLPPLKSPSEPWLAQALTSISIRERR